MNQIFPIRLAAICLITGFSCAVSSPDALGQNQTATPMTQSRLTEGQAAAFAKLALKGIVQEFPNKPSNVMDSADDVRSPRQMHPVFYGSFDWHSSVHGHWMLARLLKLFPDADNADEIRKR